jgi:hypothetical protein
LTNLPGQTEYQKFNFERVRQTNKADFSPRFGFAYDVLGNHKTVVRGGYSIYYSYDFINYSNSFGDTNGFNTTTTTFNSANSNFPAFLFRQGFPGSITQPQGAKLGPNLAFTSQDFNLYEYDASTPMSQQWNLSLQRQMSSNAVVELTYSGNHGTHLIADRYVSNTLDPQHYSLGDQLLQQVTNPYAGRMPGTQGAAQVSLLQTLLPWPYLGGVGVSAPHLGDSIYHSLSATLRKRAAKGLLLLTSYTFSKEISDSIDAAAANNSSGLAGEVQLGYQDGAHHRAAERALDPSNVPHRFVSSAAYELPWGKAGRHGWRNAVIGGWQVNGVLTVAAGKPLEIMGANNHLAVRPNLLRNPALPANYTDPNLRAGVMWFDTSAFVNPPNWTFGNASRTLPQLFGPGVFNLDASLFKNFYLGEKSHLQFRAEGFNVVNHVNLLAPNTSFTANLNASANTNPLFGRITTAADPRQVQFALKWIF